MKPGEIIPGEGMLVLNEGRETVTLPVANTGDRPIQVGSHFHFFEANAALDFDRERARGFRLDIPAGYRPSLDGKYVPESLARCPCNAEEIFRGRRIVIHTANPHRKVDETIRSLRTQKVEIWALKAELANLMFKTDQRTPQPERYSH